MIQIKKTFMYNRRKVIVNGKPIGHIKKIFEWEFFPIGHVTQQERDAVKRETEVLNKPIRRQLLSSPLLPFGLQSTNQKQTNKKGERSLVDRSLFCCL